MGRDKLEKIAKYLIENNLTIATAESCTGGLLSSRLTDISGSSAFVMANYITYANKAKEDILGVSGDILREHGAVSEECAFAMAEGLHRITDCDIAICTTGIAGPTGGTKDKPVGLIYVSVYFSEKIFVREFRLPSFLPRKLMKYFFTKAAIDFVYEIIS